MIRLSVKKLIESHHINIDREVRPYFSTGDIQREEGQKNITCRLGVAIEYQLQDTLWDRVRRLEGSTRRPRT